MPIESMSAENAGCNRLPTFSMDDFWHLVMYGTRVGRKSGCDAHIFVVIRRMLMREFGGAF
ncbi:MULTISPECIES: hypothetical protein [unclassified Caballeronia]|uniref:hypothetical protein n=1 Tax=unclassified Caballeronia TaxID=2646786 RepID=UPI0028574E86|nr:MULTISPECIES: hypothetical protein [unclassified Caballeronia]MDR5763182.1 hypothetical protein [Caballeronia sp. LZ035]MDR5883949.1 hypothetical protein [Caballeronia sp. LZ032]